MARTSERSGIAGAGLMAALLTASPARAEDDASLLRDYARERLHCTLDIRITALPVSMEPATDQPTAGTPLAAWVPTTQECLAIFVGDGQKLDALGFAERVGDTQTRDLLRERVRRTRALGITGIGVGTAALGTGLIMVIGEVHGEGSQEQRAWAAAAGGGLAFAGAVSFTAGLSRGLRPRAAHADVGNSYDREQIDQHIAAYNGHLAESLGLRPEDIAAVERDPAAACPCTDESEDGAE